MKDQPDPARPGAPEDPLARARAQFPSRVDAQARMLEQLTSVTGMDVLTHLPRRPIFLDRLTQALAAARHHQQTIAVLSIDLSRFKAINVRHGEAMGDKVLQWAARALVAAAGPLDTVSRDGADEFTVLVPELHSSEHALHLARHLLAALRAPHDLGETITTLSAHVGIALFPQHGRTAASLIDHAEAAMYCAKQELAPICALYEPGMEARPAKIASPAASHVSDDLDHPAAGSVDATYLQDQLRAANEHLLVSAMASRDLQVVAEGALRRQTEFLAVLAHELRTPLTPIRLAMALILDATPDQLPRLKNIIERQVSHITHLLSDLLDVSRISTGKVHLQFEHVTIASVIDQVVETCSTAVAARRQHLTTTVPPATAYVFGDPVRLAQIFTNLLDNASKYTPEHGALGLAVEILPEEITVCVSDNGIGIAARALREIFEPFVQDAQAVAFNGVGLGIGLTVVREMVSVHGGRVEAFSEGEGLGTRFVVTVPRAQP